MNKKGQAFDVARKVIPWILFAFIISGLVLTFAFAISGYRNKLTQVPAELRAELITLRFAQIPECFAMVDEPSGKMLWDTIDLTKFTDAQLSTCYRTEQEKGFKTFNFRLQLKKLNKEVITNNYFHQDLFEIRKPIHVRQDNQWIDDELIIYVEEKI